MAKFQRNDKDIAYITLGWQELMRITGNGFPICDSCAMDLIGESKVVLLPLLNQAYCPKCGKRVLKAAVNYPEDRPIARRREMYYCEMLKLQREET